MKEEQPNLYEGMYILNPHLNEDGRQKVLSKLQEDITEKAGQIHKIHDYGRRRLAYEIDRHREGYYYIVYFSLLPSLVSGLWAEYRLNADLLRFLTLRTDKVSEEIKFKQLPEQ